MRNEKSSLLCSAQLITNTTGGFQLFYLNVKLNEEEKNHLTKKESVKSIRERVSERARGRTTQTQTHNFKYE